MEKNNSTYMYWTDGNKNVLKLFDATGVQASYSYDPFGKVATSEGLLATDNPFRFSSEYHNDITGLVEYIYRKYDSVMGRWINRDPIEEEGGLNLYVSVYNCIIDMIDKNGLSVFFVPRGIRHKLTIDLVEEDDQPMWIHRPSGYVALPSKGVDSIIAHLTGLFEGNQTPYHPHCHCIEYIDITNHSGLPGLINFNDDHISSKVLPRLGVPGDPKIYLLLSTMKKYLCSDYSEVRFSQCSSGAGEEGKKLNDFLHDYFGERVKITLFKRNVTFIFGFTLEK